MSKLNQIATMSASMMRNPKKADCFDIITKHIESGEPMTDKELSELYKYFVPPIPAKPKTELQWVAKAMGKKDIRYYLNYIYSDGRCLLGTDGHRLHISPTDMDEGFYDTQGNPCKCDGKFPDVDRIIPEVKRESDWVKVKFESLKVKVEGTLQGVEMSEGQHLNLKYLCDTLCGETEFEFYQAGPDTAFRIRLADKPDRIAVIMPMRMS
jgi:DNA polymerase III sliding clamp (beta) subunit (PCNA family)